MKAKLADALTVEMTRFRNNGQSTEDHWRTIEYLRTGNTFNGEGDLLDAAICDFDCLYSDYCS